jgi:hypothetical protein
MYERNVRNKRGRKSSNDRRKRGVEWKSHGRSVGKTANAGSFHGEHSKETKDDEENRRRGRMDRQPGRKKERKKERLRESKNFGCSLLATAATATVRSTAASTATARDGVACKEGAMEDQWRSMQAKKEKK